MRKNKEIPENDEGFKKLLEACSLCEKDFTDGLEIDETVEFDPSKRHIRRMKRIIKRERSGRYGRNGRPTAAYIVKRAALAAACLAVVAAVFLIKPIREPVVSLVSDISDNISHPERKEFTGFTVVKKKVTPKNIDGIDVSFAPEESADYDIYSSIGRIAVISRELYIYEEFAEKNAYRDGEAPESYKQYVLTQSLDRVKSLRKEIILLLSSFNVEEYEEDDAIKEKYIAEYSISINEYLKSCIGSKKFLDYLTEDRTWQQDMVNGEIKTLIWLCQNLIGQMSNGVEYGQITTDRISAIKAAAEDLSAYWDDALAIMMDPSFPYPYRIERELGDDNLKMYVYTDETVRVFKARNNHYGVGQREPGNYYSLRETNVPGKYLILAENHVVYFPILCMQSRETGLIRYYYLESFGYLSNISDTGKYDEKEIFENIPPALYAALTEAFGERLTMFNLRSVDEWVLRPGEDGKTVVELKTTDGKTITAETEADERPLLADCVRILSVFSYRGSYTQYAVTGKVNVNVHIYKGTAEVDAGYLSELNRYATVFLCGYSDEIEKAVSKGNGYILRTMRERGWYPINDRLFLEYVESTIWGYPVFYLESFDSKGAISYSVIRFSISDILPENNQNNGSNV